MCCYMSGKATDMARLADYFIVVGYDQEKAGKCVAVAGRAAELRFESRPSVCADVDAR